MPAYVPSLSLALLWGPLPSMHDSVPKAIKTSFGCHRYCISSRRHLSSIVILGRSRQGKLGIKSGEIVFCGVVGVDQHILLGSGWLKQGAPDGGAGYHSGTTEQV